MPVYKGTTEITSGKLYKGATNIENGYKEIDPFYVNETTVSFATPTGQGFSYTTPSPQSSTGVPGSAFPSTTFVISGGSQAITGTASVSGLPSTLSVTNQSYSGSGPGNSLTITIGGTFPTTSSLNTALTISGLSTVTYYTVSLNYSGLSLPSGGVSSRGAYISGSGAVNTSDNGSTWSGQFPAGTSISIVARYNADQSGAGGSAIDYRQNVFNGGYSGGPFTVSSPFTMSGGAPGEGTTHSVSSSATTLNGNASYTVSGGYSILSTKTWGFSISSSSYSGARNTATLIESSVSAVNGYNVVARTAYMYSTTNSGIFLSYFQQIGGNQFTQYATGTIAANDYPRSLQVTTSAIGTSDYQFSWGDGTVYFSVTFS